MLARLCQRWLALASRVSQGTPQPQTNTWQKCGFHLNAQNRFYRMKPTGKGGSSKVMSAPRKISGESEKKSESESESEEPKENFGKKFVRGRPYKIVRASHDNSEDLLKILKISFYPWEPLHNALGLMGGRVPPELDEFILVDLCENMTLLAVGCLMDDIRGCAINATITPIFKPLDPDLKQRVGPCVRLLFRILEYLRVSSNLTACFGESKIFEIRILATHPDHLCKGIALELTKESLILAKTKGYRVACMFSTSLYSKIVAEKAGMHVVWAMPWSEFKDARGDQIVNVPHPHTHAYVLAKELGPLDDSGLTF